MTKRLYNQQRRNFLLGLSSVIVANRLQKLQNKKSWFGNYKSKSLKQLAADKGIIYGSYVEGNYQEFFQDLDFQSLFIQECAQLIAGFQWGRIYANANNFDFTSTDALAEFAVKNQLLFRGQPLVYHQYLSEWLIDKFQNSATTADEIRDIFVSSISTIVGRYAGRVHSWVVVNEAVHPGDGRSDGLRDTKVSGASSTKGWTKCPTWLHFLGADYIDLAFRTAAQADPQAILIYNADKALYDTIEEEAKRAAVLELLKRLKSKNTPIQALGIQAHLNADKHLKKLFNHQKFSRFLTDVANLGFKIVISELDVQDRTLPADLKTRDRLVAQIYSDFLSVALKEPAVTTVTTWGLSDRYTWFDWIDPREDKLPPRPLPYDWQLKSKDARQALANSFKNAPQRQ